MSKRTLILLVIGLISLPLFSCADDDDHTCEPQCDGLSCGPDGCGGVCGTCSETSMCDEGQCVGDTCVPKCDGKKCGDDGCGGLCGSCDSGYACVSGKCLKTVCNPDCTNKVCGFDGCNGVCGTCNGYDMCQDGQCVACVPRCGDRTCGGDGCGGSCGTCAEQSTCNDATGQCMPWRVSGALYYEKQNVTLNAMKVPVFGDVTEELGSGLPVALFDASGSTKLGEGIVAADGTFSFPTTRLPISTDRLFVLPVWFVHDDVQLAILVAKKSAPFDVWSWNMTMGDFTSTHDPGKMEDIIISLEEASGGIYLYQQYKKAYEQLVTTGFANAVEELPSMAVIWKPGMTWSCGSCYYDTLPSAAFGEISSNQTGKYKVESVMEIGGASKDESAWGTPTLLHEFGHFVLALRRDDTPGDRHVISKASDPRLAWSEGWATFYSLMSQSIDVGHPVYEYWRILGSGSYWLDYSMLNERVEGASYAIDRPSLTHESGMKQNLSEAWVTHFIYDIWDGSDVDDARHYQDNRYQPDPIAVPIADYWKALISERYRSANLFNYYNDDKTRLRNYKDADLVDFIDALLCEGLLDPETFYDWMTENSDFPYDQSPVCIEKYKVN